MKSPREPDRPILWIVAGPNGSGKSSAYNRSDIEGWGGSVWIVNPDLLTRAIVEAEGLELAAANLAAVRRIEHWLYASIDAYQTIGVETVLSSPKYRKLVERAHTAGFQVRLIYVLLASVDLQLQRITTRVREGGHDVPPDKVRNRRARSFAEFTWFVREADAVWVFDNSGRDPIMLMSGVRGQLTAYDTMPDDFAQAIADAGMEVGKRPSG